MKKTTLLLLLFAVFQMAKAQTVLNPGDIAIVQVNKAYESFDFVPLVPISIGTKIIFSDMKYSATQKGFIPFANAQYSGIHTFTASQDYAAGTVIQSANNLDESNKVILNGSTGLSIIAFQINNNDTTFITALGWLAAENFKSGVNDIPPELSIANNTVVKFDSIETYYNKYMYYSIKFDNMGDATKMEGTAIQLRRRFADNSNFLNSNQVIENTPVPNFNVLAPDIISPTLISSYPTQNKINVSPISSVELKFSEPMIAKNAITVRNTSSNATQYVIPANVKIEGTDVSFSYAADLEYATNYTLEFQKGTFTDLDNNPWPALNDTIITFATSAKRSVVDLNFRNKAKDDLVWTTTKSDVTEWDTILEGYWSFLIDGIPMRYYKSEIVPTANSMPELNGSGEIWITNPMIDSRLVVDLSALNNTVTTLRSNLYTNNAPLHTQLYSQGNVHTTNTINNTTNSPLRYSSEYNDLGYIKQSILNENAVKIDSIVYRGMEAVVFAMQIELVDLAAPVVELGANRTICEGDSVKLDAGFTPGAVYTWNTGATTQKISVKTTDTYSVTVKNTLGQRSDDVLVTVRPTISVSLPDTIYACVGDTVTLTAGTDVSNSYFWTPNGQTTPSIKVTKSGIYHVLVNNGFGGCFTTDSTRVIYKGASAHIGFNQGGMTGYNDVEGQLYRKNANGKFEMLVAKNLPQFATFDSLPSGEYILKAHFVSYTFEGTNPFIDTYHDGKTEWSKVAPFKLACNTDTMFSFTLANKPTGYEFNGTGVISGKVVVPTPSVGVRPFRTKSNALDTNGDILIFLYDGNGNLIATTYPDTNGNYSFTNLPAGNYSIGVERTGFTVQSLYSTTLPTDGTVSNADFTVDESTQTIIQGAPTGFKTIIGSDILHVSVSPNPVKTTANLLISNDIEGNATITILDITGKVCKSFNRNLVQGVNSILLTNDGFSGIYLLKVSTLINTKVICVIFE